MSSEGGRPDCRGGRGEHRTEKRPLRSVSSRRAPIAHIAQKYTDSPISTLAHHMDIYWMHEAFSQVKTNASPGVDGVDAKAYAENVGAKLEDLLERAKSGRYRAPPVKEKLIPKNQHESRAIGIPTVEDKVLQRAVAMLLEPLYEQDFKDCSYGFRKKRSAHQALDALREGIREMGGGWVLDVDIKAFFDTIPHNNLREILRNRIHDSVVLRLLGKWLNAGVMREGVHHRAGDEGTPQGGVISPLLSNVYLHEVLDAWFEEQIQPRLRGRGRMVRFADDFVMVFEQEEDARRVWDVLPKRFGKYGLELHESKTHLVDFRHPWQSKRKPETFEFLGFCFYWGKTRKGGYAVQKKTSAKKLRRSLREMADWCKTHRHQPMKWQHRKLCEKLKGHYAYYGVRGNYRSINAFHYRTVRLWRHWLSKRTRGKGHMNWSRFRHLLQEHFRLPPPRIVHRHNSHHQLTLNM